MLHADSRKREALNYGRISKFQTTYIYIGMYPKTLELILKLSVTRRPEFKGLNSQHRDHLI